MKIKSKINSGSAAQTSSWEFNTYKSGGSISLPSRENVIQVIKACDIRYFDHLATSESYKDSIFVLWGNEKGEAPSRDSNDQFDYDLAKQLRLEIYHTEGGNQYRKVLGITFHLTRSKNSVVVSSYAAHDWIDFEFPFIKVLVQAIKHGQSKMKLLKKSKSEEFPGKITSHPKKKGKLITIHFQDDTKAEEPSSAKMPEAFTATWDPTVDVQIPDDDGKSFTSNGHCPDLSPAALIEQSVQSANNKCPSPTIEETRTTFHKLMSDNEELKKEKARLQSQIDLLTARSYDQEQKIDSLFKMVNQLKCRVPKDPHEAEVHILTTTTPSPKKQGEVLAELPPSQEKRSASMPKNGIQPVKYKTATKSLPGRGIMCAKISIEAFAIDQIANTNIKP